MNTAFHDLRYAVRMMLKSPGLTLLAVVSLALGIAANVTIFSVVNAVLLRPFPFPQPDRLVSISGVNQQRAQLTTISSHDVEDWSKVSKTVEKFAVWRDGHFDVKVNGKPQPTASGIASASFFEVLGIQPAAGRFFTAEEDQPGRNHVAVISNAFWQRHFGGAPSALGGTIHLDGEPYTVVGVLPRNFEPPSLDWMEIWAPNTTDPDLKLGRYMRNRQVFARLRSAVTLQQAQSEIETLAAQTAHQFPDTNTGWTARIEPLLEHEVGETRRPLSILFGAVAVVLLIACVNVVNLLLTRVTTRRGEFAIRLALGANAARLARLLITETLLLCALGGALGLLLSSWSLQALIAIAPPGTPRLDQVRIDAPAIVFAVLLSLAIGVIVGLVPAWRAGKLNVEETLKESGSQRAGSRHFLGGVLARIEVALAMVLLIGAALLAQSFFRLLTIPADFRPDGLLMVEVFPGLARYPKAPQVLEFYRRAAEELATIPGVESVAQASAGPYFGGVEGTEFVSAGQSEVTTGKYPEARYYNISPNYFSTLGIALLKGRDFTGDDNSGSTPVAIVSQALARRTWPGEDPIGKRIRLVRENAAVQVVGVASDVHTWPNSMTPKPEIYFPYAQQTRWVSVFLMRTAGDPAAIAKTVRERIWSVEPDATMGPARTMREQMMRPLRRPRFNTTLMVLFASLATVLALVGVYGVVSFATAQRTREIGVRMALGASRADVLRMVLSGSLKLVIVGIAAGTIASLAGVRVLESLLYGVRATDPLTFIAIPILLAAATLLACYFPARRATQVDPIEALRTE
jgi:predicted permease